jgi:hypothetical protein
MLAYERRGPERSYLIDLPAPFSNHLARAADWQPDVGRFF